MNNISTCVLSVDSPKYIERSKIAVKNINEKLKIPMEQIKVFRFDPVAQNDSYAIDVTHNHQKIMKYVLNNTTFQYALIFEDDVDFEDKAAENLRKALKNASKIKNWQVMYLGCHTFTPIYKLYGNLFKVFYAGGAHAYLINKEAMMYYSIQVIPMKQRQQKCLPLDREQVDLNLKLFPKCNCIMIYPSIAYQTVVYTQLSKIPYLNVRYLQNWNNIFNRWVLSLSGLLIITQHLRIVKIKLLKIKILIMCTFNLITIQVLFLYNYLIGLVYST